MTGGIGIGTAQFGSDYGVTNSRGICPSAEVDRIIRDAARAGIVVIDTAAAYGHAIDVLGDLLPKDNEFRIVTKMLSRRRDGGGDEKASIARQLDATLERLGQSSIYGMMFHDAEYLLNQQDEALWRQAHSLKEQGLVTKIGVSFRAPEEVDHVVERYPIDIAQVPFNLLDQRFLQGGQLGRLKEHAVEVHSRSVFLQGLLIADPDGLPRPLRRAKAALENLQQRVGDGRRAILKAALDFALSRREIDCVVVGVTSHGELTEILDLVAQPRETVADCASLAIDDIEIIDPTRWPQSLIHGDPREAAEAVR